MKRFDIINYIIRNNNFTRYLEIGVYDGDTLDKCVASYKAGVDPNCENYTGKVKVYCMTSDEFFLQLSPDEKFDVTFIDGLHEEDQVFRDITNSLKHLNRNGYVILHDCNPPQEFHTRSYSEYLKNTRLDWTGTAYKGYIKAVNVYNLEYTTVDTDWGVGIIKYPDNLLYKEYSRDLSWKEFSDNRNTILNLINVEKFKEKFKK